MMVVIILSVVMHSCQQEDDFDDNHQHNQNLPFNFKTFSMNGKGLSEKYPIVFNRIDHLNNLSFQKSSRYHQVKIDTTNIKVVQNVDATSYIFRIKDSTSHNNARNYILVRLRDSIWHQYVVNYQLNSNYQVDTQNSTIEPVFGDDLFKQTNFKCGGSSFQSVWIDGYTINHRCTAGGNHTVDDGEYSPSNPNGCQAWGTSSGPTVTVVFGHWTTQFVEQEPCQSIDSGVSSGGGSGNPVDGGNQNDDNQDDSNNEDEQNDTIGIGIVENLKPPPCPGISCEDDEKLDVEQCKCIPENCEFKYGYLHESAFDNNTATIGNNETISGDNFRDENGNIITETNCDSGKIDSGSTVKVTGAVEQRNYTRDDGTIGTSNYYPITYLDCPKGNRPGNPDYDDTKPCSDCENGDPVKDMEIQPQLTACGVKGGMYGYTRGVSNNCTSKKHGGVDIKNDYGDSVYAMFDGTATLITDSGGAGHYVKIVSDVGDDTITTYYFHLQQSNRVSGEVKAGDRIGYQGDSGNLANGISQGTTESHVHIKVRENGVVVDPLPYFKTEFNETTGVVTNSNCE